MQPRTAGLKVASAHKAPEWWKEKQARRVSKIEKSAKANIAEEAKGLAETANISVELDSPLNGCFQDGYESYPCIYAGENSTESSQKWSGDWDEHTMNLGTSKLRGEQTCTTMCTQPPYYIYFSCMSHCSPLQSDFIDLTPIPHCVVC